MEVFAVIGDKIQKVLILNAMEFVVEVDWLAQHLADPQVVIVDCRFSLADPDLGDRQYRAAHIPGAYYLSLDRHLSSPVQTHGGRHPLPNPQILGQTLANMGIDHNQTLVVAYDDSKFAFAARLWWLLRYYGHDRVAVLNGGYGAWLSDGYSVNTDLPTSRLGRFEPQVRSDWTIDIDRLRQPDAQRILIDAREADRYRGEREPIDPVAGHIPGAVNYPWLEVVDERGYLLPPEQHHRRWADLDPALTKVSYCGSGVTACVNLLSMAIAGVAPALLYPGSWSDWCSYLPAPRP
jgi:thiosulfate/3-mercaptopyruvate sulfurtransferase